MLVPGSAHGDGAAVLTGRDGAPQRRAVGAWHRADTMPRVDPRRGPGKRVGERVPGDWAAELGRPRNCPTKDGPLKPSRTAAGTLLRTPHGRYLRAWQQRALGSRPGRRPYPRRRPRGMGKRQRGAAHTRTGPAGSCGARSLRGDAVGEAGSWGPGRFVAPLRRCSRRAHRRRAAPQGTAAFRTGRRRSRLSRRRFEQLDSFHQRGRVDARRLPLRPAHSQTADRVRSRTGAGRAAITRRRR